MPVTLDEMKIALQEGREIDQWSYCEQMLIKVSRTYALTIKALGKPLYEPVLVGYLFCRIADTYEDSAKLSTKNKLEALEAFKVLFSSEGKDSSALETIRRCCSVFDLSDNEEFLALYPEPAFTQFQKYAPEVKAIMTKTVHEMVDGMKATVVKQEVQGSLLGTDSMADLEQYCYYVAGTVGNMLTDLFAFYSPHVSNELHALLSEDKIAFGEGLQLTNIIKDAMGDLQRGVSFLPKDLAQEYGVDLATLYLPEHHNAAALVMKTLIIKAVVDLNRAMAYSLRIPKGELKYRLFCVMPVLFAVKTLAEASERMDDLLDPAKRVKITRKEVKRTIIFLKLCIGSDALLIKAYQKDLHRIEKALNILIPSSFKPLSWRSKLFGK